VTPPAFDDDPGLLQRVEDLAIEQLVAEASVEAFDEAVFPRAAARDVGCLGADRRDPVLHGLGDELGAVVGADMPRNAAQDEQVGEHVDDIDRLELAIDPDGETLVCELVDDVEHPEFPSLVRAILDEVVGPHMIAVLRPQPNAGALVEPQTPALRLLAGDLQPLASPDPFDPLVVDQPASPAQQFGDLAVAVTAVLPGQFDNVGGQPLLVVTAVRDLALRRAMLTERRAGATLGNRQRAANMLDAGTATRGA